MTSTEYINVQEIANLAKPLAAPSYLMRLMNESVPEFVAIRKRLKEDHSALWLIMESEINALGKRLRPERDAFKQMKRLEVKLNLDIEVEGLWHSYLDGLARIADVIGSPSRFIEVMFHDDIQALYQQSDFKEQVLAQVKGPDARTPGTWTSQFNHFIDDSIMHTAGVSSPVELLDPSAAREGRARQRQMGKELRRCFLRPDPRMPINSWVLVKVLGHNVEAVAEVRACTVEWIRREVQKANRLLKVRMKKGRPRKIELPVRVWPTMEFTNP